MEQDLLEAKNYLSQQGYGRGTNYSTNLVVILLANYAQEKVKKLQQHGVSGKYQKTLLRNFFLWICRDAKVEVIDAETAIEIRGDWSDETPLVPVLTIDELVQRFFDTCATAKGGPAED